MLCHYHGQIFNASEIGRSLAVSHHTTQGYLDILAGTFMIRILPPWFENLKKRQVKSPKIYFRDSGILNALVGLTNQEQLEHYPRLGSFWEGFALEEIIKTHNIDAEERSYVYVFFAIAGEELHFHCINSKPKIKVSRSGSGGLGLANVRRRLELIYPGKHDLRIIDNPDSFNVHLIIKL